ncbi:acc operon protein [Halonotius terrestris]|uniref:Acc operon protein n=1 Tax=Halonotius terrestris TaxID=2487750 RepID=A0A8J8PEG1_9EURY|nr:acc operon protein [Halonotius terrestris]
MDADAIDGLADASNEEAAAIAAAIGAHLGSQAAAAAAAAAAADAGGEAASQRSWRFAGRLSGLGVRANRPPASTPADAWTASDRSDRF